MDLGTLRTLVSQWVDDPQNGYFTVPTLNLFLNNAQREVQKLLIQAEDSYYTKLVTTSTIQNQQDYALPDDLLKITRLEVIAGGSGITADRRLMQNITINQQGQVAGQSGLPYCYYWQKSRLSLLPVPDQAYPLNLYYDYLIVDMVNDMDIPDVPQDFQEYIAVLAAFDCFIKDDRIPANISMKKDYYEKLLKQMAEDRDISGPRMVVMTESDDYGGTLF